MKNIHGQMSEHISRMRKHRHKEQQLTKGKINQNPKTESKLK